MNKLSAKKTKLSVTNAPTSLALDETSGSLIDLSAMDLKYQGSKKDVVSITLTTESGTLDVSGDTGLIVSGGGTGSITFTGTLDELNAFLSDATALTFTPDLKNANDGAANLSITADYDGTSVTLAEIATSVPEVTIITGTPEDDTLSGGDGVDKLYGLDGDDILYGRGGEDCIEGGAGNDDIYGGAGADMLFGGAGEDTLQYEGSLAGVIVDLNADGSGLQSATGGDAEGDMISGFENVYATNHNDILTGDAGDNVLFGYAGNDTIYGGAGDDVVRGGADADVLFGGAGNDWLRYLGSTSGVTVDLNLGADGMHQTSDGDAEGDTASGFENIYGSDFGDTLTGDAGVNYLFGFDGADTIDGGAGNDVVRGGAGADLLIGGDGTDTLQYEGSDTGVTVDLSLVGPGGQQTSGGDAGGDMISGFENLTGTNFDDVLTGDDARNFLYGLDGNDTIDGGGGNDVIRGGSGADNLIGGAGSDVLQYSGSTAGVTVNLVADDLGFQQASGGDAEGDIISEFEHVYGTNYDDVITGNDVRNILFGYGGNDTMDGGAGNDVLRGSDGSDTFVFTTELGAGNVDRIVDFVSADDTIQIDNDVFAGLQLGELDAAQFVSNSTGLAETADQRIIHDAATDNLYFDVDGSGAAEGILFATVAAGTSLDETDFFII